MEAAGIFAGLLYGITQRRYPNVTSLSFSELAANLDDFSTCFVGADEFVYDVVTGVEMITTLSYTGLMNGNMMLIDAVKDLPQDLQECTKASQDLEALEEWAATYLTPVDLI